MDPSSLIQRNIHFDIRCLHAKYFRHLYCNTEQKERTVEKKLNDILTKEFYKNTHNQI